MLSHGTFCVAHTFSSRDEIDWKCLNLSKFRYCHEIETPATLNSWYRLKNISIQNDSNDAVNFFNALLKD